MLATPKPGRALAIGWAFGFAGSVLGLWGSVAFDLPAAPSILVCLSGLLVVLAGAVALRPRAA
jgi:ABC-type Mn2+/Zn2+ transport system permease subunit